MLSGGRLADASFLNRLQEKGYGFSFDVDRMPGPFDKPALFVAGRQDATVGYRDLWAILENFPRATLTVLDRAGHSLQIEQPNLFRSLVHEWLDRVAESMAPRQSIGG